MTIDELAIQLVEAEAVVAALGAMQAPLNYKERMKADARFRLATDAARIARQEYGDAICKMTAAELMQLSK